MGSVHLVYKIVSTLPHNYQDQANVRKRNNLPEKNIKKLCLGVTEKLFASTAVHIKA